MDIYRIPRVVHSLYRDFVWELPEKEKTIYLTFDDGPTEMATSWILKTLGEFGAKATFFCVGNNVKKLPHLHEEILEQGHAVGNHTFSHVKNRKLSPEAYLEEVVLTSDYIDSKNFRPPYGRISQAQAKLVQDAGYRIIMYSLLTNDFNPDLDSGVILDRSIKLTKKGSLVVFHDSKKAFGHLQFVLRPYLGFLKSEGYKFKVL